MKKIILSVLSVFIAWSVLDFIIHGIILRSSYEATAKLWRPMGEMKMSLMYVTVLIAALAFVAIYSRFVAEKKIATGVKYGLWFGLGTGVSMGYGTYSVMPIPYLMALGWFLGSLVEATLGGLIVGLIIRE